MIRVRWWCSQTPKCMKTEWNFKLETCFKRFLFVAKKTKKPSNQIATLPITSKYRTITAKSAKCPQTPISKFQVQPMVNVLVILVRTIHVQLENLTRWGQPLRHGSLYTKEASIVIHKGDKSWRHESGDSRDRSVKSTYFKRHSGMIHDVSQRHVYLLEIPYNWKWPI